jgi:hypothetical protein
VPQLKEREYAAIFTRSWVVEFMLDLCGYVANDDLAHRLAVEPACGEGAFLLPMIARVSQSLRARGTDLTEARGALRAFDLQEEHVWRTRTAACDLLVADGWPLDAVEPIVAGWINHGDYLLTYQPPEADFVIGNPPYIRSEDMSPEQRFAYLRRWKTMTAGSDIFVGFIEAGLKSLRKGGVLSFIVADRWMHNTYGRRLRGLVADCFAVEAVVEMHGVDAFAEEVSAYPAVIQMRRARQGEVVTAVASERFNAGAAQRLLTWAGTDSAEPLAGTTVRAARLPRWFHTAAVWPSASPARLALLEELNERLPSLEDATTQTKIGIGIATGADSIFVTSDASVVEPDRLLPLIKTEHLQTGVVAWRDTWLINPWADDGSLVQLADYPLLRAYVESHFSRLKARHIAQKDDATWFRTIDKVQAGLCARPKLLFADMKATIQPVYDEGHGYPHHNLYWLTSSVWDLSVLGGLLLSRVAEMFVEAYGVKMRGQTLRFQAQYLRLIRVPEPGSLSVGLQDALANAFHDRDVARATELALAAYGLSRLPD